MAAAATGGARGKGVSRADLKAVEDTFQKKLDEIKDLIMTATSSGKASSGAAGASVLEDTVDLEASESEASDSEIVDEILSIHEHSNSRSMLKEQREVTSEVMGAAFLVKECDVDSIREGKIVAEQLKMTGIGVLTLPIAMLGTAAGLWLGHRIPKRELRWAMIALLVILGVTSLVGPML